MTFTFKVGDICIICNATRKAYLNGRECEIIAPFAVYSQQDGTESEGYLIELSDGLRLTAAPRYLRKKQPPRSAKAIMRAAILKAKQPCEVPA